MEQESRDPSEDVGLGQGIPVQDPKVWQQALENLDRLTREGRTADAEDIERAAETSAYLLGHGVLRFLGPGEIYGVVNTGQDPDERYNPRELNANHLRALAELFSRGSIKDRVSPIRVKVPADSIDEELLHQMQEANPSNPKSAVPTLELKRPNAERERQLEKEILYHSDGQTLLSDADVQNRRKELKELRGARALARLLNGNHRINAMIKATKPLRQKAAAIINAERNKEEGILEQWLELNERIKKATYTVEVYRHDTPDYILGWLAENEEHRPNYAPRAGEKLWSIVDSQEALVRFLQERGVPDRTSALNKIMEIVQRRTPTNDVGDATVLAAMQGIKNPCPTRQVTNEISDECVARLILHPAMNAMVVDTCRALWVYNERMLDSHINTMRKDFGAPLIGHYWMSIRLLLKVSNVARGEGLVEAEAYLKRIRPEVSKSMQWKGYPEAEEHWVNLHKHPQRTPALLTRYGEEQVIAFDRFVRDEMKKSEGEPFTMNYEDPGYISALRRALWAFGGSQNGSSEYARRFSASIRLYSLLPLWSLGSSDDRFFPAALLPNKRCVASYAKRLKQGADTPGLWVLETLLDEYQIAWTASAVGNSVTQNINNWSGRARGTHQILMRLTQASKLGGRDAQLQTAMNLFDSPSFFSSLSAVDKYLGTGNDSRINQLKHDCSAHKSFVGNFPILKTIVSRLGTEIYGDEDDLRDSLNHARSALRNRLFKEDLPLGDLVEDHSVLQIIPKKWWESFDIWAWAYGWNDPPAKWWNTTAYLIAWGLITNEMAGHIVPEVIKKVPAARHLLRAVQIVTNAEESEPWWAGREAFCGSTNGDKGESEDDELEEEEEEEEEEFRKQETLKKAPQAKPKDPQAKTKDTGSSTTPKPARQAARRKSEVVVLLPAPMKKKGRTDSHPSPSRPTNPSPTRSSLPSLPSTPHSLPTRPTASRHSRSIGSLPAQLDGGHKNPSAVTQRAQPEPSQAMPSPKAKAQPTNVFGLARTYAPPHVRIYASTLADTPGNILYRKEFVQAEGDKSAMEALNIKLDGAVRRAPQLMLEINKHRLHLRQSLCYLAGQIERPFSEFPFALEYSIAGLVRDIALCRDIFVARVAHSFQATYSCSMEEGFVEAILMAKTDGLYDGGLVALDPSERVVKIDFRGTFARSNQECAEGFVCEVSKLPWDLDELEKAEALMSRFMAVHGYGYSVPMIEEQAVIGATVMAGDDLLRDRNPPQAMARDDGILPFSYARPGVNQAHSFHQMLSQGQHCLTGLNGWSVCEFEGSGPVPDNYQSPWSTGTFSGLLDQKSQEITSGALKPKLMQLEHDWAEAQSLDMNGYTNNLHIIGVAGPNGREARVPARDLPLPTLARSTPQDSESRHRPPKRKRAEKESTADTQASEEGERPATKEQSLSKRGRVDSRGRTGEKLGPSSLSTTRVVSATRDQPIHPL